VGLAPRCFFSNLVNTPVGVRLRKTETAARRRSTGLPLLLYSGAGKGESGAVINWASWTWTLVVGGYLFELVRVHYSLTRCSWAWTPAPRHCVDLDSEAGTLSFTARLLRIVDQTDLEEFRRLVGLGFCDRLNVSRSIGRCFSLDWSSGAATRTLLWAWTPGQSRLLMDLLDLLLVDSLTRCWTPVLRSLGIKLSSSQQSILSSCSSIRLAFPILSPQLLLLAPLSSALL
jgi:hypothetical protein